VDPDHLKRIESIVNEQIKAELDVFAMESILAEAKQINGLRAVFGEVSCSILFIFVSYSQLVL
jgi:alanyl-tRNA synthetase